MTFLSPYVLPVAQVVWGVEIHSPHVIWKSISWHLIQFFERQKTDRWLPSPIYFYLFLLVIYLIFQLPYQQLPLELADKVIEKSKKHRMTFLSPYVLPVAQSCLRCWNSFNSSCYLKINFLTPHPILSAKKQIDDCLHRSIFIYFCWLFIFWFNYLISNFLWSWLIR